MSSIAFADNQNMSPNSLHCRSSKSSKNMVKLETSTINQGPTINFINFTVNGKTYSWNTNPRWGNPPLLNIENHAFDKIITASFTGGPDPETEGAQYLDNVSFDLWSISNSVHVQNGSSANHGKAFFQGYIDASASRTNGEEKVSIQRKLVYCELNYDYTE